MGNCPVKTSKLLKTLILGLIFIALFEVSARGKNENKIVRVETLPQETSSNNIFAPSDQKIPA